MEIREVIEELKSFSELCIEISKPYAEDKYSMEFLFTGKFLTALQTAREELERSEKYRWHDLRKDPNDLPEHDLDDCVVAVNSNGFIRLNIRSEWYVKNYMKERNVIAWRYIEPFEEESR